MKGDMKNTLSKEAKEIFEEYIHQVHVPFKCSKKIIVATVGLVGSGKTTVLKPIAEKLNLVRISTDEIRKILHDRGLGYGEVKEIAFEVANYFLEKNYGIAADGDCSNPETKSQIEGFAKKYDMKIFWLNVNPPEEFIIDKLKHFKHTWLFKNSNHAVENYFSQKKIRSKQKTKFDFTYELDTSKGNLDEQIKETINKIKYSIT